MEPVVGVGKRDDIKKIIKIKNTLRSLNKTQWRITVLIVSGIRKNNKKQNDRLRSTEIEILHTLAGEIVKLRKQLS